MTAHKHAKLMALYAQDAAETDKPWERWEYFSEVYGWEQLKAMPSFHVNRKYRRKPDMGKDSDNQQHIVDTSGFTNVPFGHIGHKKTLRDEFAMAAMPVFIGLAFSDKEATLTCDEVANYAYSQAESMMKARSKR